MKFLIHVLPILTLVLADHSLDNFIKSNDLFTSSIYKKISKNENYADKNLLVSTKGATAQEIDALLHLPDNIFKTVLTKLKNNETYTLQIANKLYINKKNIVVKDELKNLVYFSDVETIDFAGNVDAAETINRWVEAQTRNRIRDLVKPDDLSKRTRLVSINAFYFKDSWARPFFTDLTTKMDFYVTSKDIHKVETMRSRYGDDFMFYECPHLKANSANDKEGLGPLESQIDRVLAPHNLTYETVLVAVPKFKIESRIDFVELLKQMGVHKAFNEGEADFSGITGVKGDLIMDKIVQKGFIDVNEGGVEAAASTFISCPIPPSAIPEPKEFKADHPFMYYIRVKVVVVFVGRVLRPKL
ncbi:hypothetical protein Zmor_018921 [Zophobas morio]|uniref:Serpin domain-containing protein n=1 Tax=Zophobas morio TaxID=2755281 RepID=A0AA38MDK4_9CUCU|nr:hypothetical protein Zmor_018921 [Zophobas morio]